LKAGRECLREMLVHLSENLNWQTTFLQAFRTRFTRMLDVDKWYSLNITSFSGRDPMSVWPMETTLAQLGDILATSVQVRAAPRDLPIHTQVTLQRVIVEWEFSKQYPVLLLKVQRLRAIHLRCAPDALELLDGYLRVIEAYTLGSGTSATAATGKNKGPTRLRISAKAAVGQLDELDVRREALRQNAMKSAQAQ
jgi:hypothetical protein